MAGLQVSRDECEYTSCFCEENCYKLVERLLLRCSQHQVYVVLVTSRGKATPVWCQRSVKEGDYVLWDYHVLVLHCGGEIFDLDSRLEFPSPALAYIDKSFKPTASLPHEHEQLFRLIPGREYLSKFSSDRSHMKHLEADKFPAWPSICGPSAASPHELPKLLIPDATMLSAQELMARVVDMMETGTPS